MKFESDMAAIEREIANTLGRYPNVSGSEFQRACMRICEAFFPLGELEPYNPNGEQLDLVAERLAGSLVRHLRTEGLELEIKRRLSAALNDGGDE